MCEESLDQHPRRTRHHDCDRWFEVADYFGNRLRWRPASIYWISTRLIRRNATPAQQIIRYDRGQNGTRPALRRQVFTELGGGTLGSPDSLRKMGEIRRKEHK